MNFINFFKKILLFQPFKKKRAHNDKKTDKWFDKYVDKFIEDRKTDFD